MGIEFERLSEVPEVEEFPEEGASVLIEHEGNIKRCPADGLGGGGGSIPVLLMSTDPETGEYTFELEDGRTADEFVANFEKNGVTPMLLLKNKVLVDNFVESNQYSVSILYHSEFVNEGASGEYESLAGAALYYYGSVVVSNLDESTMTIIDHFEWRLSNG